MSIDQFKKDIKELIITSCGLEDVTHEHILDDAPLFGDGQEGLGLDSIDALELVLEIERQFGVTIGDEHLGKRVLRSVQSIAEFIQEQTAGRVRNERTA